VAKYIGLLSTDLRGKVGGVVGSRAVTGTTLRARVAGVNPATAAQLAQRANQAYIAQQWKQRTAAQQLTWNALAAQVTLTNSLGVAYSPTGQQLFISANRTYFQLHGSLLLTAPSTPPAVPSVTALNVTLVSTVLTAYVSVSSYSAIPSCKLYASSPRSNGVSYVSKGNARFIVFYDVTGSSQVVTAAWLAVYPQLPGANNVRWFAQCFDGSTGLPGAVTAVTIAYS
jgi:hypothetical protein